MGSATDNGNGKGTRCNDDGAHGALDDGPRFICGNIFESGGAVIRMLTGITAIRPANGEVMVMGWSGQSVWVLVGAS